MLPYKNHSQSVINVVTPFDSRDTEWISQPHSGAHSPTTDIFLYAYWRHQVWNVLCLVAQLCLTPCDPMDCGPPGSSIHGDSSGKNTGVVCHALLKGILPPQGSNPGLPHCRQILYHLSHQGSPRILEWIAYPFSRGSSWTRNQTRVSYSAGRFFTSWATREAKVWAILLKLTWFYKRVVIFVGSSENLKQMTDFILESALTHPSHMCISPLSVSWLNSQLPEPNFSLLGRLDSPAQVSLPDGNL